MIGQWHRARRAIAAAVLSVWSGLISIGAVAESVAPSNDAVSYAFGVLFGKDVESEFQEVGFKLPLVARGVEDVSSGEKLEMGRVRTLLTMLQLKKMFENERYAPPVTVAEDDPNPQKLKTKIDRQSYAGGVFIARQIAQSAERRKYDASLCFAGFLDALNKAEFRYDADTLGAAYGALFRSFMDEERKRDEERGKIALAEGQKFLASNAKKRSIQSLPSGLQYKIVRQGSGESPSAADTVRVHFRTRLIDGREIDKSVAGDPAEFPLNRVLPGWSEALQRMKPGDKWTVYLPPHLAYGEKGLSDDGGFGVDVPPNSTLICDLELVSIVR